MGAKSLPTSHCHIRLCCPGRKALVCLQGFLSQRARIVFDMVRVMHSIRAVRLPPTYHPFPFLVARHANCRQIGDVSEALQNLMLQHANMRTFVKHYLPRRVTADTRAIVSGYKPQHDLMRAACRMRRWIDPNRPQELTSEQSSSVNKQPRICRLLKQRETWKRRFKGAATKRPEYKLLTCEIAGERLRRRTALLNEVKSKWDLENPVSEVELQLAGLKFDQEVKTDLASVDDMPPIQKRLVETIMTLPGKTLKEEFRRRNAAINAVAAYCKFQEGGDAARPRGRGRTAMRKARPTPAKEICPELMAAAAEKQTLSAAMLSVFKEKRPTICFLCLGEENLPFEKRVYSFARPGDLTKHFKRKHLANHKGDRIECKVCQMSLQHKMHLQNHAERIHGTVS